MEWLDSLGPAEFESLLLGQVRKELAKQTGLDGLDLLPGEISEVSALQLAFIYVIDETEAEGGKPRLTVRPSLCGAEG